MWKRTKSRAQGRSSTLLKEIVRLLQNYNPAIYTVETFAEEQLKGQSAEDAACIAETLYDVLRYKPLLVGAVQGLVKRHGTELTRKEEWLYMVVAYLLIFGCEALGYQRFAALTRTCASSTTFLLLRLLLDADSLAQYVRPVWLRHYDASYIDAAIIPGILKHSAGLASFLESLRTITGVPGARLLKDAPANPRNARIIGTDALGSASHAASAVPTGKEREEGDENSQQRCDMKCSSVHELLQACGYGVKSSYSQLNCTRKESFCRASTAASLDPSRPSTAEPAEGRERDHVQATFDHKDERLIGDAAQQTSAIAYADAEQGTLGNRVEQSCSNLKKQPKNRRALATHLTGAPAYIGKASSVEVRILRVQPTGGANPAFCGKRARPEQEAEGKEGTEEDKEKCIGRDPYRKGEGGVRLGRTTEVHVSESRGFKQLESRKDERAGEEEEDIDDPEYIVQDVDAQGRYLKIRFDRTNRRTRRNCSPFQQRALQRPSNMSKLLNEAEKKFAQECSFTPQRSSAPPKCAKRRQWAVRFTTAEILRADLLLQKRQEEVYARSRQREIDKRDERFFVNWQFEQKKNQEKHRLRNVARKRAFAQLSRAQGMHAVAVAQNKRASQARAMKDAAAALQRRRYHRREQEKLRLVQRAVAIWSVRHRPAKALEKVKERKKLHATAEKSKRALALTETYKSLAKECFAKNALALEAKAVEGAALHIKHLVAGLRRRRCRSLFNLSAPTLNGMCLAEAKARLKFLKVQRAEGVKRRRQEILRNKAERSDELVTKAITLAIKREEDAKEAELRRRDEDRQQQQRKRKSQLRMEKALFQQRDKIWEKKQQQKNARLRLATALRIQQMNDEFLNMTKRNIQRRVQQQLIRGAERRAIALLTATRKEQVLLDEVRKKAKYLRATNRATAKVEQAARDAARAEKLRNLQCERDEEQERARQIISYAAALRRTEEKELKEKRKTQSWQIQQLPLR